LNESSSGRIFISYRRQETAWPAGRLYDRLVEHFPREQVFRDVDNVDLGDDFVERITTAVESCDVLLVLIGPQWLTMSKSGRRRLDDPRDYVRLEIETALTRKIRVIPILLDEAQMPDVDELPPTLAPLARRNALEISPLTFDTVRLISTVRKTLAALRDSHTASGPASPTPAPKPDPSRGQVAGLEVEQLYNQALAAFRAEHWDKAIDLFGQVLSHRPNYANAARKLELARRQQQLASRYAQASAAADSGDWQQAVATYTMIADADPDYRDASARLADARRQQQRPAALGNAPQPVPATEAISGLPMNPPPQRSAWFQRALIASVLVVTAVLITVVVIILGKGGENSAAADFTEQGDIEVWHDKDVSGNFQKLIDEFNAQHPNGKVTLHELPGGIGGADQQRQQLINNTQIKNPKMAVMSVDVVWTAEFAAKGYIEALPADLLPTTDFLPASVDSATYSGKLYAYPSTTGGGLLYYRKDLLDKYGLKPPTTFDEMKAACHRIQAGENDPKLGCFAGQYNQHEGMTVNIDEAIRGAGGVIVGDDGKPNVATPQAVKGLQTLVDRFRDGDIPEAALTWRPAQGRKAFQNGELIFHRNWGGAVYDVLSKTDGSSKVAGKFDVAVLPGITGPGVSSVGGQNYVIAKYAENKGTAVDFLKFMSSPEAQKSSNLATSNAPVLASLYSDPEILKKYPYMPTLLKSIRTAKPRPKAVDYVDVTLAIQDAAFSALQGRIQPDMALQALQAKLETLIK
jgi:multiple sugar transport system substrate-binding protein